MIVYVYNKDSKLLTGEGKAQRHPLRKDEFINPIYSTQVVPPEVEEGETPKFDEESQVWSVVISPEKIEADARAAQEAEAKALKEAEEVKQELLQQRNDEGVLLYELVGDEAVPRDQAIIDAETHEIVHDRAVADLKQTMNTNIINKSLEITKASNIASAQAFISAYQVRVANALEYASDGLVVLHPVSGYNINDALDTEQKIIEYYNKVLVELDKFRNAEIATYLAAKAAL